MQGKYINPFTDFGFKKIFAEEASKPLLIDFLNALLNQDSLITDITFKNTEKLGFTQADRKAVYDIFCDNNKGEKFIVELQKLKQNFFKDRTVYYSTFPIVDQAEKGEWNYELNPIYCIGILGFTFESKQEPNFKEEVVHTIKLKDQNGKVFYEKLTYIYLEMPNFRKKEEELETRLDKWLFFIKNLEDFQEIPAIFGDAIFESAFEKAELAKYNDEEHKQYQASLKTLRDNFSAYQCATDEGKIEGIKEGIIIGEEIGIDKG
jgi:predicted transposase/invertase (TIGR01784 family)